MPVEFVKSFNGLSSISSVSVQNMYPDEFCPNNSSVLNGGIVKFLPCKVCIGHRDTKNMCVPGSGGGDTSVGCDCITAPRRTLKCAGTSTVPEEPFSLSFDVAGRLSTGLAIHFLQCLNFTLLSLTFRRFPLPATIPSISFVIIHDVIISLRCVF